MDCVYTEFVDYFKEEMEKTGIELNIDSVYTLGSVHVVSHNSHSYVDNIFGSRIINVINPIDPIPRMFSGNKKEPKAPLKPSKRMGVTRVCMNKYGKSLMDNVCIPCHYIIPNIIHINTNIICSSQK